MFATTKTSESLDYRIERSLRFRRAANGYFQRVPTVTGSQTTWTWSAWVKRAVNTSMDDTLFYGYYASGSRYTGAAISATGELNVYGGVYTTGSSTTQSFSLITNRVLRDPSAWYHIVITFDSPNATAGDRVRVYVNGVRETSFSTASYPAQNAATYLNVTTSSMNIGWFPASPYYFWDGYMAEINFIDGQALDASSFGQTDPVTGVWGPKKYTGTYGTNGSYLKFDDNSGVTATTIGKDSSGNGNNWTPANFSVTAGTTYDSMIDTPTPHADGDNGRGNYATLNPVDSYLATMSNANLTATMGASTTAVAVSSIAVSSGKWYAEYSPNTSVSMIGVSDISAKADNRSYSSPNGWYYFGNDGTKYNNGVMQTYGAAWSSANIIGVALDCDAGTVTFYKDGVSQGVAYSTLAGKTIAFGFGTGTGAAGTTGNVNFGQRPFAYTPPSGFKALNTQNLPNPTIVNGSQYFNSLLYTGNGGTLAVTGVGFSPDFTWVKSRGGARSHVLVDKVRGNNLALFTDATAAETAGYISSLDANGFTVVVTPNTTANVNSEAYVSWNWKEGATPGFDIVTYTGNATNRTIAHNLGAAPSMMIVKQRTAASSTNWEVYHSALSSPATTYLELNNTNGVNSTNGALRWNNTAPTSSVFSLGTGADVNTNTGTYVAYLFAEVAGFSKFGSYTGNGNTDGPFVYCGFRPRWIMVKRTDTTGDWVVLDSARSPSNIATNVLYPNLISAEASLNTADFLSNGFKLRLSTGINVNSGTYVFAAFAENPFKYALAR